MMMVETNN